MRKTSFRFPKDSIPVRGQDFYENPSAYMRLHHWGISNSFWDFIDPRNSLLACLERKHCGSRAWRKGEQ